MFKISPHVRQYLFSGRDSADAHFHGGLRPQRAGSIALMILLLAILGAMGYRATVRSISLRLMEEHNVALAQAVTRGLSTELSMLMNPNRAT
ncbi:MAG TPA: hypothetical protein VIR60_04170, partial [Gammaproteobacteria bacterium]